MQDGWLVLIKPRHWALKDLYDILLVLLYINLLKSAYHLYINLACLFVCLSVCLFVRPIITHEPLYRNP